MSKHLDDFLSAAVTLATSPSELPAGFPGQPSVREKQNQHAGRLIASGCEPVDVMSVYGQRQALLANVTGGAPLMRSSTGDWRPAKYVEVDVEGKAVPRLKFADGEDA
jgi:hypothetical protein